ncbi:nitrilase-related carbon-nitrogen hydrolase [Lacrimispora indolis]|uniref:nitrilase-related carbon-nitrogen hydrolase n=1 Tax=Lacrimispora indolis TaxID=69825 RepID=UPI0012EC1970
MISCSGLLISSPPEQRFHRTVINSPYISYGNSIVASPWGDVIYRADEKPTIIVIDIDLEMNKSIRSQLPLLSARRTDLYKVEEI